MKKFKELYENIYLAENKSKYKNIMNKFWNGVKKFENKEYAFIYDLKVTEYGFKYSTDFTEVGYRVMNDGSLEEYSDVQTINNIDKSKSNIKHKNLNAAIKQFGKEYTSMIDD